MKKKVNWDKDFNLFLHKHANRGFAWGSWDCCIFSNEMIKAITGESVIPKSWKWKNEKEAMASIKKHGKGKGLAHAIDLATKNIKGIKEIGKAFVTKGDLVVYKEESELCGIHDGYAVLTPTDDAIGVKQDVNIVKVWRIDG